MTTGQGGEGDEATRRRLSDTQSHLDRALADAAKLEQERDEWRAERDKLALAYELIEQERDEARGRAEMLREALALIAAGERPGAPDEDEGHGVPDRVSLTADDMQEIAEKALGAGRGE